MRKSDDVNFKEKQLYDTGIESLPRTDYSGLIPEHWQKTKRNHGEHHRENQGVCPVIKAVFERLADAAAESRRR